MYYNYTSDRRHFLKQSFILVSFTSLLPFEIETFMNPKGVIIRASSRTVKETIERIVLFGTTWRYNICQDQPAV
jgi:hypothetical protein